MKEIQGLHWRGLPGYSQITWLKTVLDDLKLHNLILIEAIDTAQNRLLRRLLSANGTTPVVHKLQPTGQIWPAKSRQVARKVQHKSLKYEKYCTSFTQKQHSQSADCGDHLEAVLRLTATSLKPDISKLAADMQRHPSH